MALSEQEEFELLSLEREKAVTASGASPEEPPQESGMLEKAGRSFGLSARSRGPVGVGAGLGAAMGGHLGGVGALPGAAAGASAAAILQMIDRLGGTDYISKAMDALGLPKAESPTEKLAVGGMDALAGMAGVGGAASTALKTAGPALKPTLEAITQSPGLGAISSVGL